VTSVVWRGVLRLLDYHRVQGERVGRGWIYAWTLLNQLVYGTVVMRKTFGPTHVVR
jgi:hypothetical protein